MTVLPLLHDQKCTKFSLFQLYGVDISIAYDHTNTNVHPVGMETTMQTGQVSVRKLDITTIHAPNKSGRNVQNGNRTYADDAIDAEAIFTLSITSK